MTKKQFDERSSDLARRIRLIENRCRELADLLQNSQPGEPERTAIEEKLTLRHRELELVSDQFDQLLTAHINAVKAEAERSYGKPQEK